MEAQHSEPPSKHDLERTGVPGDALLDDRRPPVGAIARHLGPQFTLEEVRSADDYVEDERVQRFVRAFPVPALSGVELRADSEEKLAAALVEELERRLDGTAWRFEGDLTGPLRKYGLLHTSLSAPADDTTGHSMALELCGELISAGEVYDSRETGFFDYRLTLVGDFMSIPLPGPLVIRLQHAVYANVLHPGIGMPFYS